MKLYSAILAATLLLPAMTACSSASTYPTEKTQAPKSLVLYYSQTGATKAVAEKIADATGADIEEIVATEPYSGDFNETIARCMKERAEGVTAKINPIQSDLSDYDIIYLGYPIWFGTYAPPVQGLLEEVKFEGKKVVPFCTFGSGGLEASIAELKAALPEAEILDGYGVRNARIAAMPAEVDYFLIKNGYVEGEVAELPDFSGQTPVTDEEKAIFDAACGDYQFPLGTPVTVGQRALSDGTEYQYTVVSNGPDGAEVNTTIYVIAGNEEGAKPEFTRVVR